MTSLSLLCDISLTPEINCRAETRCKSCAMVAFFREETASAHKWLYSMVEACGVGVLRAKTKNLDINFA